VKKKGKNTHVGLNILNKYCKSRIFAAEFKR